MYSFLFELITSPLGLPINPIWEYVILAIANIFAFVIAWNISPGGRFGSEIHWSARLVVFFVIWVALYMIIAIAKWVISHWIIVLAIIGALVAIGLLTLLLMLIKRLNKKV